MSLGIALKYGVKIIGDAELSITLASATAKAGVKISAKYINFKLDYPCIESAVGPYISFEGKVGLTSGKFGELELNIPLALTVKATWNLFTIKHHFDWDG